MSRADPETTAANVAARVIDTLLWVKPHIRSRVLQMVLEHFNLNPGDRA